MTDASSSAARADATARLLRERLGADGAWIEVTGASMLPTIRPPARVRVAPASTPRLGEVWAFVDDDGELLAHRYLRTVGSRLRFKGDGNPAPDRLVARERLVGVVVEVTDPLASGAVRRRAARSAVDIVVFGLRRRWRSDRP